MSSRSDGEPTAMKNKTTVERTSDLELVVTRTVDGPAHLVFEAWTKAELFRRWWVPKSLGLSLLSCELDVRVGGGYKLVFAHGDAQLAFYGRYLEVVAPSRLVWTNDEAGEAGAITTVTFEARGGQTLVVVRELYPSKDALDANSGSLDGMPETLDQLDALLASLDPSTA